MQSHSLIIKEENFLGMEKRMRKNGKKIRLLGVATLLASQLGVFSSALTVVADETTASTSEPALVTNTSSEESSRRQLQMIRLLLQQQLQTLRRELRVIKKRHLTVPQTILRRKRLRSGKFKGNRNALHWKAKR